MKVNVISDLHIDFADLTLPGGEVLLICGDACEAKRIKPEMYTGEPPRMLPHEGPNRRPDRFYRFFQEEGAKYDRVLYIAGNHEHYGYKFDKTHQYLRENLPAHVEFLECDTVEINDWLFVGTTLWTDLGNGNPLVENVVREAMSDYHTITKMEHYGANPIQVHYRKLRPKDTTYAFYRSRDYIEMVAKDNPDKNIVVMTHHAPSRLSVDPMFDTPYHQDMNRAYYSDLDQLILDRPNIKFWCHGHTHSSHDYMIGDCRVICNPRGYYGHETCALHFDPTVGFEI